MTELSAEAKEKIDKAAWSYCTRHCKDGDPSEADQCAYEDFKAGAEFAKQESLAEIEKLKARIESLLIGLSWYAAIGDDGDTRLEDCLLRAMDDRSKDNVTINLGGKYVADVAIKAIAADTKAREGG